ncbi:MAG: c-type cytochrome biogenesis protein CcmI [Tranquillimonas sp.]
MTFLWISAAVLALIAVAVMLAPLRRGAGADGSRDEQSVAILADQLREVESDAERGLIGAEEARAAQVEIKRRLLAVNRRGAGRAAGAAGQGRGLIIAAAVLVPLGGAGIYWALGAPQVPSLAFAERQQEVEETAKINELTRKLLTRLENDPEGGPSEGWLLLGQTYMRMGRYPAAAQAYQIVSERDEADSTVFSQLAEALIAAENGIVTPRANRAIDRARELDPQNPAGVYYKSIALNQDGQTAAAYDLLLERLNSADGFAPWMELFVGQANRIGEGLGRQPLTLEAFAPMAQGPLAQGNGAPGPSAEDVAAASEMTEEDRAAFIRSMVARLAARLEEDSGDLDGWMRLANAYKVLGETDKARDALGKARELTADLASDDPRKEAVQRALSELNG